MRENGAKKSPLNDGVCVSFFKKTVHQVSVRLGIAIFFFREQAAKLCFSAHLCFVPDFWLVGTAPVKQYIGNYGERIGILHVLVDGMIRFSSPDSGWNPENKSAVFRFFHGWQFCLHLGTFRGNVFWGHGFENGFHKRASDPLHFLVQGIVAEKSDGVIPINKNGINKNMRDEMIT